MPTKKDLGALLEQAQKRWLKSDEKEQKQRRITEDANAYKERFFSGLTFEVQEGRLNFLKKQADAGNKQAAERYNSITGDERFGKAQVQPAQLSTGDKVLTGAADIGYDIAGRPLSNFAKGLTGAVTSGERQGKIAESQKGQVEGFKRYTQDFREGKIDEGRYRALVQSLERPDIVRESEDVIKQTNPLRFAAAGAEIATAAAGGALAGAAQGAGTAGRIAIGAGEGALLGGLGSAQQEDVTGKDVLTSVGAGAVLGGAAGYGGGKLSDWLTSRKVAKEALRQTQLINTEMDAAAKSALRGLDAEDAFKASQGITDPARLLPDGTASKAVRLAEIDDELDGFRLSTNTQPKAERARALIKERQQLIEEIENIKNPQNQIAEEINFVDSDLARAQKTANPAEVSRIQKQQTFLEQEADKTARTAEFEEKFAPTGRQGVKETSRAAERAEADAIESGLADGFDNVTTYDAADFNRQANIVVDTMNQDYDLAKRIAMGQAPAPEGTQASAFYTGVRQRARAERDVELLRRLATESTIPKTGSQYGQFIAAFAEKNPEDPVTVMQTVLKAREKAQPNVPATISKAETEKVESLTFELEKAKKVALNGGDAKAYGQKRIELDNYKTELALKARPALKESLKKAGTYTRLPGQSAGLAKSLVATLDNSIIGRQGWKVLTTHPVTWVKNSLKSFEDIARTYGGQNVLDHVHADVVSRKNALNGLYKAMGLDVYGAKKDFLEEAFPVSFQKVTGSRIGKQVVKPFKASEAAFSGWQQRTRADLADQYLEIAKKNGVDLSNPNELKAIGKMVNSLTSRGHLGGAEKWADGFNKMFFSPRLFKSNLDVLGGHIITGGGSISKGTGSNFVRKRAARNLLKMAVGSALALKLASAATGGRVEADPRSSDFGKVKVGNTRFDLAGGMAGLVTLGARMITDEYKSASSGEVIKLNTGDADGRTTYDVLLNFAENKLSPAFGAFVDIKKGEDFDGNKPTVGSVTKSLTVPLIIQSYQDLKKDTKSANDIASIIAEGLGISVNTYGLGSDWNISNTKQVTGFKSSVSKETFKKANEEFNDKWTDWYESVSSSDKFWKLPQEERFKLVDDKRNDLTKEVLKDNGYKYKSPKRDSSTKSLIKELSKY